MIASGRSQGGTLHVFVLVSECRDSVYSFRESDRGAVPLGCDARLDSVLTQAAPLPRG